MTILVTGATGTVGGQIVRQLVEAGHAVRALTRDPAKAEFPAGVEVVGGDLADPGSLAGVFDGVSAAHLITFGGGYRTLSTGREIFALAKAAGVAKVTVLRGPEDDEFTKEVAGSGVEATLLVPVEFMSNHREWAAGIIAAGRVREGFADSPSALVHEADIAAVAVAALTQDGHGGKEYTITGPEVLTVREKVAVLAEALGRDIELVELSEEEVAADLAAQGWDEASAAWMIGIRKDTPEIGYTVVDTVERVTGRPARTFAQWARENASVFGG
ncbi:NAD(P)H-binding protein [Phytomonospora sp. NPDC050363]|uniref:NmrA family NAD(P)-binding protein n=1 Tax=Phytomonospora sp. NPDC050363 TaxID=3155642 RepID=UPI0033F175AC